MRRNVWHSVILLSFVLVALPACTEIADSENPLETLQESDLVGTWTADYGHHGDNDNLILRLNGTFKQIYQSQAEDYVYETPWNEWWMERFPDGRMRVHLKRARYYLTGIREAEQEGVWPTSPSLPVTGGEPWSYYDPFAEESVYMVGELVLNVRVLPSGELVLAHMWGSSEWGFGDADLFHRVETTSPLQTPAP